MSSSLTMPAAATADVPSPANRIPRATYRLQLRGEFGFDAVDRLVPYLDRLGISDLYLSPLFRFREDSTHGYDVVDHSRIEPTFGDRASFRRLAETVSAGDMGILLDLVPNHMGINDPGNHAWRDVLENGPAARHADYFDIDWNPPGGPADRVLLPFLGRPYGEALEAGELTLKFEDVRPVLAYFDRRFPIAPATWPQFLDEVALQLEEHGRDVHPEVRTELASIITQLRRLPPAGRHDDESTQERYREQEVARRRLAALLDASPAVGAAIDAALERFNGTPGEPRSWDRMDELLNHQFYRLAYWRVAVDEINYRRFFDINDLAAIRVEEPAVFDEVHRLAFELLNEGSVTGLRIDHPDGLLNPREYFKNLQDGFRRCRPDCDPDGPPLYILAEKILSGDEALRSDWPISGTTGYDLLNRVSAILVDPAGVAELQERYRDLTGITDLPRDVAYHGKQTILHDTMASELYMVASQLFRLAKSHRSTRDFTLPMLLRALREVIACFSVYRTYTEPQGWDVDDEDRRRIMEAVRWAKRRNRTMARSLLDYIAAVLLLDFPPYLSDEQQQQQWRRLAVRTQQLTGPVTAKGIEDTAFYRYYPLASLNEVGAEPGAPGMPPEHFHFEMQRRMRDWPHALSATATHDTKRGEDVRCRLHVLSEIPDVWADHFRTWTRADAELLSEVDGDAAPTLNERYLIYQTLLATWPLSPQGEDDRRTYTDRMCGYFQKAFREAKVHTSWLNCSETYEAAIESYVRRLLEDPDSEICRSLDALARRLAGPGFVNSLSQLVLKMTLPGVPDFYQGCEFWDFRLVDPDNRRPVDYDARSAVLDALQQRFSEDSASLIDELRSGWDDSLKMLMTWRLLEIRRGHPLLFSAGDYEPLEVTGRHADRVIAFARRAGDCSMAVILPRLVHDLAPDDAPVAPPAAFCGDVWGDTAVRLPPPAPASMEERLSGDRLPTSDRSLAVSTLLARLPAAVLFSLTS